MPIICRSSRWFILLSVIMLPQWTNGWHFCLLTEVCMRIKVIYPESAPNLPVASLRQYYKWYLIKDHWGSNLNRTWHGEPSLKAAVSFLEALVFEDIETQLFFCTSLGLSGKELMQRMCRETSSTLLLSSSVQCCGLCTSHDMLWTKSLCISYGQFIYWLVLLNISLWRK